MSADRMDDCTQKLQATIALLSNRDKQDLIRLSFSTFDFLFGRRMFNPLRSV